MAIYHLSASIIGRSAGRSITAAAAYRAAIKIEDQKTGAIHNYNRKKGVDHSEILSPVSVDKKNDWLTDREKLWNRVEMIERRKDAQLAREVTLAIPTELPKSEKIALVREYVEHTYVAAGMIADVNMHHLEGNNPHAHILLTMRNLQTTPDGTIEFGLKNTSWNSKELLIEQRKSWEENANKYLKKNGVDAKIDCRSLENQGSPFIPQIHVGVHAMAMRNKGITTDRSEEFDRIKKINDDIRKQLEEIYQLDDKNIEDKTEFEQDQEEEFEYKNKDNELGTLLHKSLMLSRNIANNTRQANIKPINKETFLSLKHYEGHDYQSINYHASLTRRGTINIYVTGYDVRLCEFRKENNIWTKEIFYNKGMEPKRDYFSAEPPAYFSAEKLATHINNLANGLNTESIENYIDKKQYLIIKRPEYKINKNGYYLGWKTYEERIEDLIDEMYEIENSGMVIFEKRYDNISIETQEEDNLSHFELLLIEIKADKIEEETKLPLLEENSQDPLPQPELKIEVETKTEAKEDEKAEIFLDNEPQEEKISIDKANNIQEKTNENQKKAKTSTKKKFKPKRRSRGMSM